MSRACEKVRIKVRGFESVLGLALGSGGKKRVRVRARAWAKVGAKVRGLQSTLGLVLVSGSRPGLAF